jgi:hypothetical protein
LGGFCPAVPPVPSHAKARGFGADDDNIEDYDAELDALDEPTKVKKGDRARFRTAADSQRQLKEIEDRQRAIRQGKIDGVVIDNTGKSKQRLDNSLRNINNHRDAKDNFSD